MAFRIKVVGGNPKPEVKWFFEETEIITTNNEVYEITEIDETFYLTIKNVKPSNTGTYYVQLINEAGTVNSNKAQLNVNCMFLEFILLF